MESEVRTRGRALRTGITVPCLIQGDVDGNLLLLHAWGESRHCFDRPLPGLTGYRVYAPDLRGQGGADKPEDGHSSGGYVQPSGGTEAAGRRGHRLTRAPKAVRPYLCTASGPTLKEAGIRA